MVQCAVYGCNSNNNKKLKKNSSGTTTLPNFFSFPNKDSICRKWVELCCRKEKFTIKNARICSLHFTPYDYLKRYDIVDSDNLIKRKLKPNAVPSLNFPKVKPSCPSTGRSKRLLKRNIKQMFAFGSQSEAPLITDLSSEPSHLEQNCSSQIELHTSTLKEEDLELNTQSDEVLALKNTIAKYENEIKILRTEKNQSDTLLKLIKKIFSTGQLKKLQNEKKRITWGVDDISSAIALHAAGPRAYRWLLKKGHPLPALSTLRKWAAKVEMEPGILETVLQLMKNANLTDLQKVCIISADEMKIQKCYEYDKKKDSTMAPANYVQVFMARGLFGNWKQPVYYNYDCKMSKDIVFKIIECLENINYKVVGLVTDLGGGNRGFWNELGIHEAKPWFENSVTHKRIHVFGDAPHLMKLLRNHFLDSGFIIYDQMINANPLHELFKHTSKSDLNIAHKLTVNHLSPKNAERQKVKLATQLFSHTNSCALTRFGTLGLAQCKNWMECANMLKTVNDWFDVFNVQVPENDSRERIKAYGLCLESQEAVLSKMSTLVNNMRVGRWKTKLPFQKGILLSIESLRNLYSDLKQDYKITYILTYRLNQDHLEGFFSIMRAAGGLHDHPKALDFKYRLRKILLGRNESIILSDAVNVEPENSTALTEIPFGINMPSTSQSHGSCNLPPSENTLTAKFLSTLVNKEQDDNNGDTDTTDLTELQYDGLENIAGYIAFKLRNKFNDYSLGYPTAYNRENSWTWANELSEGGLYKPTSSFMEKIVQLQKVFELINGDTIKICKNYLKFHMESSKDIDLAEEAKILFFRCKMYFRINFLNQILKEKHTVSKRKIIKIVN